MKRSTRSPAGFQIWDGAGWTGWGKGGSGEGNSREPGKPDDTTHYPFSRKRTTAIPKRYLTSPLKFTKKSCFIFSTYLVKRQFSKCSPPKCQFWFWLFSLCLFFNLLAQKKKKKWVKSWSSRGYIKRGGEKTQYENRSHWKGEKVIVLDPNVALWILAPKRANEFFLRPAKEPLIFISHSENQRGEPPSIPRCRKHTRPTGISSLSSFQAQKQMHNTSALVTYCGSWSPRSKPGGSYQCSNLDPGEALPASQHRAGRPASRCFKSRVSFKQHNCSIVLLGASL